MPPLADIPPLDASPAEPPIAPFAPPVPFAVVPPMVKAPEPPPPAVAPVPPVPLRAPLPEPATAAEPAAGGFTPSFEPESLPQAAMLQTEETSVTLKAQRIVIQG